MEDGSKNIDCVLEEGKKEEREGERQRERERKKREK